VTRERVADKEWEVALRLVPNGRLCRRLGWVVRYWDTCEVYPAHGLSTYVSTMAPSLEAAVKLLEDLAVEAHWASAA